MVGTMIALGLLAAGVVGGAVASKKLGNKAQAPVPGASSLAPTAPTLATGASTPTPPDATKLASSNVLAANAAGLKARRRAAAGSAGRVTAGTPSPLQQTIRATDTPRTLLGS